MNNHEINRINNMTFKELRNELANCGHNKTKENIIRNIMYARYKKHIENKMMIERSRQLQIMKQQQMKENQIKMMQQNNNDNEDNLSLNSNDFEIKPHLPPLNELEKGNNEYDNIYDTREIQEYDRDMTNNNIIDRLNSDIDIRTARNKKIEYKLIPPYSDGNGDNYAPFNSAFQTSRKSFSNIKPKKNN